MPQEPRYGMDHDHYDWSAIVSRKRLRWPEGARVALATIVVLDHLDFSPPEGLTGNLPSIAAHPSSIARAPCPWSVRPMAS